MLDSNFPILFSQGDWADKLQPFCKKLIKHRKKESSKGVASEQNKFTFSNSFKQDVEKW